VDCTLICLVYSGDRHYIPASCQHNFSVLTGFKCIHSHLRTLLTGPTQFFTTNVHSSRICYKTHIGPTTNKHVHEYRGLRRTSRSLRQERIRTGARSTTGWQVGRLDGKLGGFERHLFTRVSWHFAISTTDGKSAVNRTMAL
jgi:hypothetical protein